MTRQAANYEILNKLYAIVEKHPDLRFQQILQNYQINLLDKNDGVVSESKCLDLFYEESEDTLKRLNHFKDTKDIDLINNI